MLVEFRRRGYNANGCKCMAARRSKRMISEQEMRDLPANAWLKDPAKLANIQRSQEDFDWAMAHHAELEKQYIGQSVAICNKQIVAHGKTEEEVLRHAEAAGISLDHLVVFEFPDFFEMPCDWF